jgi:hypothetical protein
MGKTHYFNHKRSWTRKWFPTVSSKISCGCHGLKHQPMTIQTFNCKNTCHRPTRYPHTAYMYVHDIDWTYSVIVVTFIINLCYAIMFLLWGGSCDCGCLFVPAKLCLLASQIRAAFMSSNGWNQNSKCMGTKQLFSSNHLWSYFVEIQMLMVEVVSIYPYDKFIKYVMLPSITSKSPQHRYAQILNHYSSTYKHILDKNNIN